MEHPTITQRLVRRGSRYSVVGICTFFLDLSILAILLATTTLPYPVSVTIGFLVGVSINFAIAYHFVYPGTTRRFRNGYLFFIALASSSAVVISLGTILLVEMFAVPLVFARVLIGSITGTINFLINTFFNFKLV